MDYTYDAIRVIYGEWSPQRALRTLCLRLVQVLEGPTPWEDRAGAAFNKLGRDNGANLLHFGNAFFNGATMQLATGELRPKVKVAGSDCIFGQRSADVHLFNFGHAGDQ